MSGQSSLLKIESLEKSYGPVLALKNANFEVLAGEIHALLGANGAGKSTLCDILTKLVLPTSGDIYIDDQALSSIGRSAWRKRVGYVSQEPFLFHASDSSVSCTAFQVTEEHP